jgi:NADH-quinone oxidoreductase subunit M
MISLHLPLLTILTFLPTAAALLLFILPARQSRWIALASALISIFLTHVLWHHFDSTSGLIQYEELHAWIPALHVQYRVGIDGLGLLMLLLTAIVTPIGIFASWRIDKNPRLYFALVLLLQTCLFGTFTALNFIHWFLYWELGLIPAFFLIALWGGPKARAAATQFLVYTMVGSITLLLAFLAIFQGTGTFDFTRLAHLAQANALMPAVLSHLTLTHITPAHAALVIFFAAFLGFAVKVPLIPFHTWLPTTYAEAPTGTTILLTGAMSKMGLYGFLRILLPLFAPQIALTRTPLLWLAVATIVLSSFAALAQKDLKRIFAYSSINHLGYCLLAIFALAIPAGGDTTDQAAALAGVFLQIFNHALTAATVFFCIALLEKRSNGLRGLNDFGGLRKPAPVFAGLMGIALFSSLGLPGLNGFPGEFLIFKGSFPLSTWATSLSVIGLMITAVFILGVIQKVFSGPVNPAFATMPDLTLRERLALAGPIALMFILGLYPQFVLGVVNQTAVHILQTARFF